MKHVLHINHINFHIKKSKRFAVFSMLLRIWDFATKFTSVLRLEIIQSYQYHNLIENRFNLFNLGYFVPTLQV